MDAASWQGALIRREVDGLDVGHMMRLSNLLGIPCSVEHRVWHVVAASFGVLWEESSRKEKKKEKKKRWIGSYIGRV